MTVSMFVRTTLIHAPVADVWARVTTPEGINHELRPWMTMSLPRGAESRTIDTITVGQPLGRAWIRLFGLLPIDFDHLTVAELEPGRRFLERSTMLSMRRWEHERTLTADGNATLVRDQVTLQPRVSIPGLAPLLSHLLHAFFGHRHRRLRSHFAPGYRPGGQDAEE